MIKEKKINLNLVVIYYTQINLFLYIQFPIKVADVDIQVEMGLHHSANCLIFFAYFLIFFIFFIFISAFMV